MASTARGEVDLRRSVAKDLATGINSKTGKPLVSPAQIQPPFYPASSGGSLLLFCSMMRSVAGSKMCGLRINTRLDYLGGGWRVVHCFARGWRDSGVPRL